MDAKEDLEKHLISYSRYYTIKKEDVTEPFYCEAEFISHTEKFVLVKAAHIADIDSNEFVYFHASDNLTLDNLLACVEKAWETGIGRVKPYNGHRNSDITVVFFSNKIEDEVFSSIKKVKKYKSYKFSLWGYSHLRVVIKDVSNGQISSNFQGRSLRKIFK